MEVTLDVFPANVVTPEGEHSKVRVIVADGRVYVFGRNLEAAETVVAAASDLVSVDAGSNWPYRLTTADGPWTINRAQGCGCGHPLKRARQSELLALIPA